MICLICPGFHLAKDTVAFVKALEGSQQKNPDSQLSKFQILVYPAPDRSPVLSWQIVQFLRQSLPQPQSSQTGEGSSSVAIAFLGFSAGVVGALGAAHLWQHQGGQVQCLMALDGWGVPLWGDFPIHRLSHDSWTHWTTGGGQSSTADFYADPAVTHLDLWRAPQRVWGWRVHAGQQQRCCATDFIGQILSHPT